MRIAVEPVLDVLPARWSELCQMACYDLRDPLIEEISTGNVDYYWPIFLISFLKDIFLRSVILFQSDSVSSGRISASG
jgi:hypothetical protein